jgi:hypothetical protein
VGEWLHRAANCDGAANREKADATCVAKGLAPSCTVANGVTGRTCAVDVLGTGCVATCTATNAVPCHCLATSAYRGRLAPRLAREQQSERGAWRNTLVHRARSIQ